MPRARNPAHICAVCFAFTAAPAVEPAVKTTMLNKGQALPKGACRRFPKAEAKDPDDWCLEWTTT